MINHDNGFRFEKYFTIRGHTYSLSDGIVKDMNINGTSFAGPFSSSGGVANYYFDLGGPIDLSITGKLNMTANGGRDESLESNSSSHQNQ